MELPHSIDRSLMWFPLAGRCALPSFLRSEFDVGKGGAYTLLSCSSGGQPVHYIRLYDKLARMLNTQVDGCGAIGLASYGDRRMELRGRDRRVWFSVKPRPPQWPASVGLLVAAKALGNLTCAIRY